MNLACRLCRKSVAAEDGCAACLPYKKNLVATDENSEEAPSLSEVGSEVVVALRERLRDTKRVLETGNTKARLVAGRDVILIANSLAKVLEAARKLQNDGVDAIKNMSFLQRAELFVDWYVGLPPAYRAKVREEQSKMDGELNRPAELPAGAP